ncbi:family 1 glycosylhydrolase [Candidatus Peregrinibacteria bacterium]|nr:family 1 glycosylhydrolase [Candidatus Peregrinibacteria bacterium]
MLYYYATAITIIMVKKRKKRQKEKRYFMRFPKEFYWGTSMSAHQVEGQNIFNDWWEWEQRGKILNRQVSGDACKHYDMYREDFKMMKSMHHSMHRLSIEWSRIEQTEGQFNTSEINHYRKVLKELKKQGITPMVTLFHFTLPHWFAKQGAFLHPDGRKKFIRYVRRVVQELGDLVDYWVTINEPYVYTNFGYWEGLWPPGKHSLFKFRKVLKELLHTHIDAYQTIKKVYKENDWTAPEVGFAKSFVWFDPQKKNSIMSRAVSVMYQYLYNKLFFRPFYTGRYPLLFGFGKLHDAKKSLDFVGMNYYFRCACHFSAFKSPLHMRLRTNTSVERTLFNWEVFPKGLYRLLKITYRKIKKPIFITENGISTLDDTQRISYIVRHLEAIHRAMREGVDVRGYLYWSFIDNFEWAEGYTQPFGLVGMNHRTFERIPKPSSQVYAAICKTGKITDSIIDKYAKGIKDRILK